MSKKQSFFKCFKVTCIIAAIIFLVGGVFGKIALGADNSYAGDGKAEFTEEEKEYIEKSETFTVALYGNMNVWSSCDSEEGNFSGIAADIFRLIEEKSGLKFNYIIMPENVRGVDFFAEGKADIIAPIIVNQYISLSDKIETVPLNITSDMVTIVRKDFEINADDDFTIAVPYGMFLSEDDIKEEYPNAKVIYKDTQQECLEAVKSKEADVTLQNRLMALYKLCSPLFKDKLELNRTWVENQNVYLMVSVDADPLLKSVLKKTADSIDKDTVTQIIVTNTSSQNYEYSLEEIVYLYRYYIFAVIVVAAVMLYLIVLAIHLKKRNKKSSMEKKLLEEKRKADEEYKKKLYIQANYDSMTGLLNRRGFYENTEKMLAANPDTKFIMLRGDIDQFKVYNDIMGVEMGDRLILHLADIWSRFFSKKLGVYGYLGGDDYICCYPYNEIDSDELMDFIGRWLKGFNSTYTVSVSVGAYVIDEPDIEVGIMCDRTELALAKAKEKKKHFCLYENEMRQELLNEREMANCIPAAIENEQFEVYLQPQYDSVSGKIVGAEALSRWNHPEQGIISPGVFIPIMEKNNLITLLDKYVIEKSCRIINDFREKGLIEKGFSVAVNLSRADTFNNGIVDWITGTLSKYKIPVEYIRLEITESVYVEQYEQVRDFVSELKQRGFVIEMDDFGSGYSSLNTLKDVPVDTLKLDLKFLAGENTERGGIIINSVIKMARWLGIPVIAEGVETESQAEFLRGIGCHYMQGYYFAKPMQVNKFEELLKQEYSYALSASPNS